TFATSLHLALVLSHRRHVCSRCGALPVRPHARALRAHAPHVGARQHDARRRALLRGLRAGHPAEPADRRDGGGVHGDEPRAAARGAPLREPHEHGRAGAAVTRVLAASAPRALGALLRGVLAFPITPYADDGAVDLAAVHANARWLAGSGMYALVAPSGTGELFSLTPDECAAIVLATVEAAARSEVHR